MKILKKHYPAEHSEPEKEVMYFEYKVSVCCHSAWLESMTKFHFEAHRSVERKN